MAKQAVAGAGIAQRSAEQREHIAFGWTTDLNTGVQPEQKERATFSPSTHRFGVRFGSGPLSVSPLRCLGLVALKGRSGQFDGMRPTDDAFR